MIVAINVKTELWNRIVALMIDRGWTVAYKYGEFDASIDFDLVVLEKENEAILFGLDN